MDSITPNQPPPHGMFGNYTVAILTLFIIVASAIIYYYFKQKMDNAVETPQRKKFVIGAIDPLALDFTNLTLNGAKMAIDEFSADTNRDFDIEFRIYDNSGNSSFDKDLMLKQIKLLTTDDAVIGFWGPTQSLAAKIIIPMLNQAGIAMISPVNSWPGLTKSGFSVDEPVRFYPNGIRNYTRIAATDELEMTGAVNWGKELGFETVSFIGDETLDTSVSIIFTQRAANAGMILKDRLFVNTNNSKEIASTIAKNPPDFIYFYGLSDSVFGNLVVDLKQSGYKGKIMASDCAYGSKFQNEFKVAVEGVLLTSSNSNLHEIRTPASEAFIANYKRLYKEEPGIYAGMGYEAMRILLNAIRESNKTRVSVMQKLSHTDDFPTMFGNVTFDANGDYDNGVATKNIIENGQIKYLGILEQSDTTLRK